MKITSLTLKNFRNYPELNLEISDNIVVLSGPNAVGKTNLLESIYFASLFKSFRDDTEFIFLKGTNSAEISVGLEKQGEKYQLEVYLERRDKIFANFKVNGVKFKRKDAQGLVSVVIFDPTEVDMFSKTPDYRRKYLNLVLSQKQPSYLEDLAGYKKVLYQKTKLLQDFQAGRQASVQELDSWNEQLVSYGTKIILARKSFVNFLNQNIAEIYTTISGFHRPIEVRYETINGQTGEEIKQGLLDKLAKYQTKERVTASCLVGPHRDDFYLISDGLYLSPFSSRGELRSQVLALKILELEYLSHKDDKPILLLDDVLSELDETRRTFLLRYLQGKFQTFITTTYPLEMAAQHITLTPTTQEAV